MRASTSTTKSGAAWGLTTFYIVWHMIVFLLILAICASVANNWIDGTTAAFPMMNSPASIGLLFFSLLAASVGFGTMMMAAIHGGQWNETARYASLSANLITFAILALAFGFACKAMNRRDVYGNNSVNEQLLTVAAFDIITVFTMICYLIHLGMFKHTAPEERAAAGGGAGGTAVPKTFVGGHEDRALSA